MGHHKEYGSCGSTLRAPWLAGDDLCERREVGHPLAGGLIDPRTDRDRGCKVASQVTSVDRLVVRRSVTHQQ